MNNATTRARHDYGTVTIHPGAAEIIADGSQLRAWAARPGHAWPCSELAEASRIRIKLPPATTSSQRALVAASLLLCPSQTPSKDATK